MSSVVLDFPDLLVEKHPPPVRLHLAKGGLDAPCLLQRVPFQGGW